MRLWCLPLIFFVLLSSCAHQPAPTSSSAVASEEDYNAFIVHNTVKTNHYSGFHQTFQADMTILSNEVQSTQLKQRAAYLQWDSKQLQTERDKMLQENSAYAKFFLRFYSPVRDYDDLHKGKSIWRIYLEVSGRRLEGKVKKMPDKFVDIKTLYPFFDHFSTAYEVTFSLPMVTLESKPCKVTLTSSLGSSEFAFPVQD